MERSGGGSSRGDVAKVSWTNGGGESPASCGDRWGGRLSREEGRGEWMGVWLCAWVRVVASWVGGFVGRGQNSPGE